MTGPQATPHHTCTTVETVAGRVGYQCPAAIAKAVHEAVDGALERRNEGGVSTVTGPHWYFAVCYTREGDECAGIRYRLYLNGEKVSGQWAYADPAAARRAINEIVENLGGITAERAKRLTGPVSARNPRPYTDPDSLYEALYSVHTIAGRVYFNDPVAVARAVFESVDSALEMDDRGWIADCIGPRWHFEVSHKRDYATGTDVGIYWTLFRDVNGTGFSSCGSWAYGDRGAAVQAIREIVEKLNA
jgi:hypothetical protein